jgi:dipeptidase D
MLEQQEPKHVWKYFEALCKIPRPSGHEEAVGEYVITVADQHHLKWKKDSVGNVVVLLPATRGREDFSTTVLQGHLDMVGEKNSGTAHDFLKDPIRPRIDGEWVRATGTTLGADNGIGVAMALALIDDPEASHGPLELLFTVDEETGLNGANSLKPGFIRGKRLLNLDTEEDGQLYVGCAGGVDTSITLPVKRDGVVPTKNVLQLAVKGLRGGHSGVDIHEGRGNANRVLVRTIWALEAAGVQLRLVAVEGGSKRNAIPREAFATLVIDPKHLDAARKTLKKLEKELRLELAGVDDGLKLSLTAGKAQLPPMAAASQAKVINLLGAIPHGPISYSRDIPDLVETSTNFAIVTTEKTSVQINTSQRSSVWTRMLWAARWLESIGSLAGGKSTHNTPYPGWKPNLASPLLKQAQNVFQRLHGTTPRPKAIHAGLECGIIGARYPGIDMISLGPDIKNPHSPDEAVSIPSVAQTYKFLKELLKELA